MRNNSTSTAWPPISQESRSTVTTPQAAFYLHRSVQTLRIWSMRENGPIRPLRINGRLLWRTDEIRALLGEDLRTNNREDAKKK